MAKHELSLPAVNGNAKLENAGPTNCDWREAGRGVATGNDFFVFPLLPAATAEQNVLWMVKESRSC